MHATDTIVAIATAPGSGGIGVVRLSGPQSAQIGARIAGSALRPRHAHYARFRDTEQAPIDDGIALWFAAPASYTGEDVVELQAHGSPAVLRTLLEVCVALGARMARPGEFSERAFLNGRLDLAQAEAVADLIATGDRAAAQAARRSLDGAFSQRVDALAADLLALRVQVEALIDFADEPLQTLGIDALQARASEACKALDELFDEAKQGRRLRDGLHAVIVGPPNAGKSSLLNALARSDRAIVTDVAGTTRDLLHETVRIDGIELTMVDTAGLRAHGDAIEREGMRRARAELQRADLAIVVLDAGASDVDRAALRDATADVPQRLWVDNKTDLYPKDNSPQNTPKNASVFDETVRVSALTGAGLDGLRARLAALAGGGARQAGGTFSARARHVDALARAQTEAQGVGSLLERQQLELAAEALRLAHDALGEITGRVLPDDLLGAVFSTFCIGK